MQLENILHTHVHMLVATCYYLLMFILDQIILPSNVRFVMRVTVVCLSVCLFVCLSVTTLSSNINLNELYSLRKQYCMQHVI